MKIGNRYIPFKFLQKILFKISRESNGFDLSKLQNEKCSVCGRENGDFYDLPPTSKNKVILRFKVKLQYHKFNNSSKIVIVCQGCHLRYHLIEKINKINQDK
jgi:hypothetical protein